VWARLFYRFVVTARRATGLALALLVSAGLLAPALAPAQEPAPRIVGGTTAEAGEYPWQVAVLKTQGQSLYFICGGTLMADRRVVTAAHCTSGAPSSLKVLVGTQRLSSGGSILNVSSYADHPSYSSSTNRFDAAVLELATSGIAAGGETLSLIGQEGSANDALWAPGKLLAISGWGSTSEGGSVSDQLREAEVPRVADSTCGQSDHYGSAFDPATMVCAGFDAGGVDTCQGDSGGPLAASTQDPLPASANDPSQWRLTGITSWGDGCARPKKPGVYTRVAAPAIRNWILGTTSLFTLNVSLSGTGSGKVTSNPGGINCLPDCSFGYTSGTNVTLTATADSGSAFTGWTGAGCSGTGTCTVTMDQARSVDAEFTNTSSTPTMRTLTVVKSGGGSGTVTSNPAGINCGSDCSASFTNGTSVTLTATPASGSTFAGWEGEGCSGTGTCTVAMDQAREVTATFGLQAPTPSSPPANDPSPTPGLNPSTPSTPSTSSDTTPPVLGVSKRRVRLGRNRWLRVRVRCGASEPEPCRGILRLYTGRRRIKVASKRFEITPGKTARVRLRLSRRGARLLKTKRRLRVLAVARARDAAGNLGQKRVRFTLLPPRP
jgi:secreted trypsin-like serine protease